MQLRQCVNVAHLCGVNSINKRKRLVNMKENALVAT